MRNKITILKTILLAVITMVGSGSAIGATYTHTFAASSWTAVGTQTLTSVAWDFAATWKTGTAYFGYDATKGQQFGSSTNYATAATLSTSGISGTITSVKLTTSGASSTNAIVSVSVGGTAFTVSSAASQAVTSTSTPYNFTGSASGNIVINWSQTSAKALYLKTIEVTYSDAPTNTPTLTVTPTTLSAFTYNYGSSTPSAEQSFTVVGANLTNDVSIALPANYEISTGTGASFVAASTAIPITMAAANAGSTTIYVRLKTGLAAANYNENITVSSANAETRNVACSGTVDNGTGLTYTVSVPVTTKACYINGTMNGATFQVMNKVDATHYSITIPNATLTDTYKYYSGPNASYIELDGVGAAIASRGYSANDVVATWASIYDTTTYYNITVQVGANGNVKENNIVINNGLTVTVASGATKTFTFTPTAGYELATLTYNGVDVKSQITNNQYTTAAVLAAGTLNVTFQKVVYNLAIKSAENGVVNHLSNYGDTPSFSFTASAGWKVNTVTYNGIDVTSSLVNGVYTVAAITANALLNVSFVTDFVSGAPEVINSKVKVFTTTSDIVIDGAAKGEVISLFTVNGQQLQTLKSDGKRMVIPAQQDAVYLVKTASKTFKVIL
jgi:hypothetical protein